MSAEPQDAGAPICDAVTLEVIRGALRARIRVGGETHFHFLAMEMTFEGMRKVIL